ncbi:hypothetical protein U5801_21350 [Lamprobacter modestohalophilus]|uniref:hypothetical protein n=1 Tax=Lamprobacter modestohalophilus TaxID=1064514 RepID=UPI002ADEBDDA|nr:hypothetical protein [Lamprobacter modestohalophilus]MEA1052331.1 hypothetical protein [Lamprobacter modestohalophilus]
MRVRIIRPAAIHTAEGLRTLVPGLVVELAQADAQRVLALGNATALQATTTSNRTTRTAKTRASTDAPT